jgi:hypothetical protein
VGPVLDFLQLALDDPDQAVQVSLPSTAEQVDDVFLDGVQGDDTET